MRRVTANSRAGRSLVSFQGGRTGVRYPVSSEKQDGKKFANFYNHRSGFTTMGKVSANVIRDSRWVA